MTLSEYHHGGQPVMVSCYGNYHCLWRLMRVILSEYHHGGQPVVVSCYGNYHCL